VTDQLTLTIVMLSDSFRSEWGDLAEELKVRCSFVDAGAPPAADSIAVIVAAGGEEDKGLDVLLTLPQAPRASTFLVGASTSHRFAVEAVRRGAADYFALPGDLDLLRRTLAARVEAAREGAPRAAEAPDHADVFNQIIGESEALRETLAKAARVLPHRDVTVLINGDTGTGKEVLARALHEGGPRASAPFVAVNCAAIPPTLLESELFGHEKGAFTDAQHAKPGLFEEAHTGTLFLDEVGHLPVHLQGKLLRALEDRQIRRVGGTQSREVDVRIITATHVNLRDAVSRGEFREDLYYRLNVIALTLPPLRDRGDDLVVLAQSFAQSLAARYNQQPPALTPEVMAALKAHSWPGNVRELRHAIERALLLSPAGTLSPSELDLAPSGSGNTTHHPLPFPATLHQITAAAAQAAVDMHSGNKSAAARQLQISRARLQRLLDGEENGVSS
jgi:DNA-binding NtrC family response regulator